MENVPNLAKQNIFADLIAFLGEENYSVFYQLLIALIMASHKNEKIGFTCIKTW